MRTRRVLFFAKCPMNYVLFEPVHRRLARVPGLGFLFTGKYQGRKDPALVYRDFDLLGGRLIRNSVARWLPFDLYVTPDFRMAGRRARVRVHMFHGFSIRNFAIQERALRFDRLFLIGPYMRRRFVESGLVEDSDPRLVEVGMPKLDRLARGEYDRRVELERLGLDPSRKTVLFAPTWIPGGCLDTMGFDIVRELGRLDVNTIVKLHDNSFDLRKQRVDWARALPEILGPNQRLAPGYDSSPYLYCADALISDASSVANEYLLLDRPLIFFRLPALEKHWPATDRETWGTRTGLEIERAEELAEAVEHVLDHPDELRDVRRSAARDFFYNPGSAARVAARRLLGEMGLSEAPAEEAH